MDYFTSSQPLIAAPMAGRTMRLIEAAVTMVRPSAQRSLLALYSVFRPDGSRFCGEGRATPNQGKPSEATHAENTAKDFLGAPKAHQEGWITMDEERDVCSRRPVVPYLY